MSRKPLQTATEVLATIKPTEADLNAIISKGELLQELFERAKRDKYTGWPKRQPMDMTDHKNEIKRIVEELKQLADANARHSDTLSAIHEALQSAKGHAETLQYHDIYPDKGRVTAFEDQVKKAVSGGA